LAWLLQLIQLTFGRRILWIQIERPFQASEGSVLVILALLR